MSGSVYGGSTISASSFQVRPYGRETTRDKAIVTPDTRLIRPMKAARAPVRSRQISHTSSANSLRQNAQQALYNLWLSKVLAEVRKLKQGDDYNRSIIQTISVRLDDGSTITELSELTNHNDSTDTFYLDDLITGLEAELNTQTAEEEALLDNAKNALAAYRSQLREQKSANSANRAISVLVGQVFHFPPRSLALDSGSASSQSSLSSYASRQSGIEAHSERSHQTASSIHPSGDTMHPGSREEGPRRASSLPEGLDRARIQAWINDLPPISNISAPSVAQDELESIQTDKQLPLPSLRHSSRGISVHTSGTLSQIESNTADHESQTYTLDGRLDAQSVSTINLPFNADTIDGSENRRRQDTPLSDDLMDGEVPSLSHENTTDDVSSIQLEDSEAFPAAIPIGQESDTGESSLEMSGTSYPATSATGSTTDEQDSQGASDRFMLPGLIHSASSSLRDTCRHRPFQHVDLAGTLGSNCGLLDGLSVGYSDDSSFDNDSEAGDITGVESVTLSWDHTRAPVPKESLFSLEQIPLDNDTNGMSNQQQPTSGTFFSYMEHKDKSDREKLLDDRITSALRNIESMAKKRPSRKKITATKVDNNSDDTSYKPEASSCRQPSLVRPKSRKQLNVAIGQKLK